LVVGVSVTVLVFTEIKSLGPVVTVDCKAPVLVTVGVIVLELVLETVLVLFVVFIKVTPAGINPEGEVVVIVLDVVTTFVLFFVKLVDPVVVVGWVVPEV
jgi:hypothetical protein